MVKNTHKRILNSHTGFAYAAVCGLVIGVGDLVATTTDIVWCIGDMMVETHPHHWPVMIGLVLGDLIMLSSFIWLYRAISVYLNKKAKKHKEKMKKQQKRISAPLHCNVSKKNNSQWLRLVPDFSEN